MGEEVRVEGRGRGGVKAGVEEMMMWGGEGSAIGWCLRWGSNSP